MDFSKIHLLPEELRLLKSLAKKGSRQPTPEELEWAKSLHMKYQLIQPEVNGCYSAKKDGRRYLLWLKDDRFRHRKPVYIASASLAISLLSLIVSLFSLLRS